MIFLVVDIIIYLSLVILTDYGLFPFIWDKIKTCYIRRIEYSGLNDVDSDVAREKMRVGATLNTTGINQKLYQSKYCLNW